MARAGRAFRRAGGTTEQIRELFALLSAFCGWPAALAAHSAVNNGGAPPRTRAPRPRDRVQARRRGWENFQAVYGDRADTIFDRVRTFDPSLSELLLEVPYGELYARPLLDLRVKETLACLFLTLLEREPELRGHAQGARRCGARPRDLEIAMQVVEDLAGKRRARIGRRIIAEVWS